MAFIIFNNHCQLVIKVICCNRLKLITYIHRNPTRSLFLLNRPCSLLVRSIDFAIESQCNSLGLLSESFGNFWSRKQYQTTDDTIQ